MSGTTTTTTNAPPTEMRDKGAIVTSIFTQATFLLALAASCIIAWAKGDYTLLIAMCGIAGTNSTSVVNYWIGNSAGSVKKSDQIALLTGSAPPPSTLTTTTTAGTTGATGPAPL